MRKWMKNLPKFKNPIWFKVGMIFLVINTPIGIGSLVAATVLYINTGYILWIKIGGIVYGVSWIMLGLGVIFAGPEGTRKVKRELKMFFGTKWFNSYKPKDQ